MGKDQESVLNILAIETSTLTGSVALLSGEDLVGEITLSVSVQHSERLMPAIDRLLRDATGGHIGPPLQGIDLFAVAVGPGSFTGLRIGIAAAQGLALASGKPIVGVSTLEALALNGIFFPGLIVPILDAFRGEVYRGLYQKVPGTFCQAVAEDRACGISELTKELREREEEILLLGSGADKFGEIIAGIGRERVVIGPTALGHPRAANVALLAQQKYGKNLSTEPVVPRYLRSPG